MIIGCGLLANTFKDSLCNNGRTLIFASGVSNSSETSDAAFLRERVLLEEQLSIANETDMLFIYFSSCALVDKNNLSSPYYYHKHMMEQIIKKHSHKFIIFRLPQLIGKSDNKNTLINYLVEKIQKGDLFEVWKGATRYLIEVNDLKQILEVFIIDKSLYGKTIDIANPYRYSIEEIVSIIACNMQKKAVYNLVDKQDSYLLNLDTFLEVFNQNSIDMQFGKEYLEIKLKEML